MEISPFQRDCKLNKRAIPQTQRQKKVHNSKKDYLVFKRQVRNCISLRGVKEPKLINQILPLCFTGLSARPRSTSNLDLTMRQPEKYQRSKGGPQA